MKTNKQNSFKIWELLDLHCYTDGGYYSNDWDLDWRSFVGNRRDKDPSIRINCSLGQKVVGAVGAAGFDEIGLYYVDCVGYDGHGLGQGSKGNNPGVVHWGIDSFSRNFRIWFRNFCYEVLSTGLNI